MFEFPDRFSKFFRPKASVAELEGCCYCWRSRRMSDGIENMAKEGKKKKSILDYKFGQKVFRSWWNQQEHQLLLWAYLQAYAVYIPSRYHSGHSVILLCSPITCVSRTVCAVLPNFVFSSFSQLFFLFLFAVARGARVWSTLYSTSPGPIGVGVCGLLSLLNSVTCSRSAT